MPLNLPPLPERVIAFEDIGPSRSGHPPRDADEYDELRAAEGILIGVLMGLAIIGAALSLVVFLWR